MRIRFALVVSAAALSVACASESAASKDVRTAAAAEMDCDPSELTLDERRPRKTHVSGCGQEQIYRYKCTTPEEGDRDKKECGWTRMPDPGN